MLLTLYGYIVIMLLALPSAPEPPVLWIAADAVHYGTVRAVEEGRWTGRPEQLARKLVVLGHFESNFLMRIQEGDCRIKIGECDHGRAASWWQLQRTGLVPHPEWITLTGPDHEAARRAAYAAARVVARGKDTCRTSQGALSFYATGRCDWPRAAGRMKLYQRLLAYEPRETD